MANGQLRGAIGQLRRLCGGRLGSTLTDAQLLEAFLGRRDQASFEVLVWRHGSMVLNLCQRILRDSHEAEDAFQAAFLILARKARSIGKGEALASWLYKVAYRVALRARARGAQRGRWEEAADDLPARQTGDHADWNDLRPVLDEEIGRPPEKYCVPFVLCYLEGHTNEEAAAQLGCPKGTILSRLARGRDRLRWRLTRRGIALSTAALTGTLSEGAASAALPVPLVANTAQAATALAAGQAVAGLVSPSAAALYEGVIHTMYVTKLKIAAAVLLGLAVAGTGLGIAAQTSRNVGDDFTTRFEVDKPVLGNRGFVLAQERGREPSRSELRGQVKAVDAAAGKITIATLVARDQPPTETTYALAKDVEVAVGAAVGRGGVFKESKLAELVPGTVVSLSLAADKTTVDSILAEEPTIRTRLRAVDAARGTLTVLWVDPGRSADRGRDEGRDQAPQEKTLVVAKNAEIVADDGRAGPFALLRKATLADLAEGTLVTLCLSLDSKQVHTVLAEGPTALGTVKAVDAAKKQLTLVMPAASGDDGGQERTLQIADDAVILLDDGRGRLLSARPGKLADVPAGAVASVRLTVDQHFVTSLRVQGPTLVGQLKSVDAAKSTIIIALPPGARGEEPEEKTLAVAKNATVAINGTAAKLTDLNTGDNGPQVQLRLSLDQTRVQRITLRTAEAGR
jgi:RNA polymerase sigma factor (sigma-70 family)